MFGMLVFVRVGCLCMAEYSVCEGVWESRLFVFGMLGCL